MEASDQYAVNKSAVTSGQSFDHWLFAHQTSHKDFQQEIENVTPGNYTYTACTMFRWLISHTVYWKTAKE